MSEPIDCPFCGSANILREDFHMCCLHCGAEGPDADEDSLEAIIEAWNRRASGARLAAEFTLMPSEVKPEHRLHLQIEGTIHRYVREDEARLAALEECAKLCEDRIMGDNSDEDVELERVAKAIRELAEKAGE